MSKESMSKKEWKIGCDGVRSKKRASGMTRRICSSKIGPAGDAAIIAEVVEDDETALEHVLAERGRLVIRHRPPASVMNAMGYCVSDGSSSAKTLLPFVCGCRNVSRSRIRTRLDSARG
jgi:hypothetical protein